MIQLDTRNGHNQSVIEEFNKVSRHLSDAEILYSILTYSDDREIEGITASLYGQTFVDMDGNILNVGDFVVLLDDSELEEQTPRRGDALKITKLIDLDSNFIECNNSEHGTFSLFGYRLLKLKKP
jgi:uncharacterized Zn ribbon protein